MELTAISPLDGRYATKLSKLRDLFSEYGLIYHRLFIEIRWLFTLTEIPTVTEAHPLTVEEKKYLENMVNNFNATQAKQIKQIEQITNHDVKAIEYYIREKIKDHPTLKSLISFIHFACTSEDINNLAYAIMLTRARSEILLPEMQLLIKEITTIAKLYTKTPMLGYTHGQPAIPTTLGKEFINFVIRLEKQKKQLQDTVIFGKFNGAIGNFNAHRIAYPDVDWLTVCQQFVTDLGVTWNNYTTQIEPHDYLAEFLHNLSRFNTILIDFNRDIWSYISLGYFYQKQIEQEVGSSTMPHKINPIDFENSEGNLGLANALANHMAQKLPISRWQRDLTDSTVLRNLGTVLGYSSLAYQSALRGIAKLAVNETRIQQDLDEHWEVLAEAIQTVMRRYGIVDAYEQLKAFTRGKLIDASLIKDFISQLNIPDDAKKRLQHLTPNTYLGDAVKLSDEYI